MSAVFVKTFLFKNCFQALCLSSPGLRCRSFLRYRSIRKSQTDMEQLTSSVPWNRSPKCHAIFRKVTDLRPGSAAGISIDAEREEHSIRDLSSADIL